MGRSKPPRRTIRRSRSCTRAATAGAGGPRERFAGACLPPTGLCSFRVSFRVRDNSKNVLSATTTTIRATADSCSGLCSKALNNVVVQILDAASAALKPEDGDAVRADAGADGSSPADSARKARKGKGTEPAICGIAAGGRLPPQEAQARAAQVEVLKRLEVLDQGQYDCLRKAYLGRL